MSYIQRLLTLRRGVICVSNFKIIKKENATSTYLTYNRNNRITSSLNYASLSFLTLRHIENSQRKGSLLEKRRDCRFQERSYAKGKDKGKVKGKSSARSHITEDELAEVINVEKFKTELNREIENLKEDYLTNLSLRSNVGSLETLLVELEGDKYPLSEIAQVIRKSPTMVIINATDYPQATVNIKKAIQESGMNLNPQQEGTTFYIPIPKITREHREKLALNAKSICDKTKTELRGIQNKYIKKLNSKEKVSQDLIFNSQLKIREMTQDTANQAEELMKNKQSELLKVLK